MGIDDEIRQAAGRGPAGSSASLDSSSAKATEAQLSTARLLGLPEASAHRLRGEGAELHADGRAMLADLEERGYRPPAPVSFDGGAREPPPRERPSVDSMLRAAADQGRADLERRALFHDRTRDT